MTFKVKNNQVFFRDYNLSDYMTIKEINIDIEKNKAFVTAEFNADVDVTANGVLFAMVNEMDESNLIDLKDEVEKILSKSDKKEWQDKFDEANMSERFED